MKVAIIGAGISGLYLARKLAERGESVTVFEKRKVIGKEACSGLFSQRVLDLIPESKKLVENEIDFCLLHFPNAAQLAPSKTLKINFSKKFFVMSHYALDNLMAGLAERAGAKIILNNPIESLPHGYDRIIGTDGANSRVRKILKERDPAFRLGIQGFTKANAFENHVDAWPTPNGFLWKIPRGKEIEWGIIEKPLEAKKLWEEFIAKQNLKKIENIKSTLVPQGLILPKNPKVTLCGDASGLTKPWSGGGVAWSLVAISILLKNFPDFLKYRNEARRFFLPKIVFSKMATRLLYFGGSKTPSFLPQNWRVENDFLI